jgi:hypothetical protein
MTARNSPRQKGSSMMKVFSIVADNHVVVYPSAAQLPEEAASARFESEEELTKVVQDWPSTRLVAIWNSLPGVETVRKFRDRQTAVRRIWEAVQNVGATAGQHAPTVAAKRRRPAHKASKTKQPASARRGTKSERVLALLRQPAGATLKALMRATGWQAHSVRGFLSGQVNKKMKLKVKSFERDGERVYAIFYERLRYDARSLAGCRKARAIHSGAVEITVQAQHRLGSRERSGPPA